MTMIVTNNCKGIVRLLKGKIELLPGQNTVQDSDWQLVNKSAHVVQLIAMKQLSVASGGNEAKPLPTATPAQQAVAPKQAETPVVETLVLEAPVEAAPAKKAKKATSEFNAREAIHMVKKSDDHAWLRSCLALEDRNSVVEAIEQRLEDLKTVD